MSEVHVYGVVPASDPPELRDKRVRQIAHRDIAALVSDIAEGEMAAARALRLHWRVLDEAGEKTTVLPVRFGTVMPDDRAVVEEFLEPEHDELAATLAEMAGKVQLTLKGFYDEQALMTSVVKRSPAVARLRDQVAAVPQAAAYYKRIELGQRVAEEVERFREQDARTVLERLEPLAVAARREPPSSVDAAVHVAFLVDRGRIDEFGRAVSELGRELEGRIELQYIGPLPPYSFTARGETAGASAWA